MNTDDSGRSSPHTLRLLEAVIQGSDDMVAAEDPDFRYLYVNDAYRREFSRLWGREPEIGMSMVDAMAPWPDQQQKARELWGRAMDGESYSITTEFGPSEAERKVYQLHFYPVYDDEGRRMGAAHIFRDVTERVRTQEALRRSEERFRLINLSTREVIWDWDLETDRVHWDGTVEETFGLSRSELGPSTGDRLERVHPADRIRIEQGMDAAIHGDATDWSDRYRFLCARGVWKTFLDRGHIARRKDGTAYRMIGTMQDISDAQAADAALAERSAEVAAERDRLRAVLEILPVAVFIADASGRIVLTNKTVESMWGRAPHTESPDSYRTDYRAWWADTGEPVESRDWAIARALERGETSIDEEIEIETADGERKTILNYALPIRDESGGITGAVALNVDITQIKETERELEGARDAAEAANQAKTDFLAHMSHELRTPISGIIGMVDLALRRSSDPELSDHLRMVRDSAESLSAVVGDVLDLSKVESGVLELTPREWDPAEGLEAVLAPFRLEARRKGLEYRERLSPKLPERLYVDGPKIAQVLRNLVSNALKYTEEGAVTVVVGIEESGPGVVTLILDVSDTGPGIAPEMRGRVFESFVRLRESVRTGGVPGTGLGLSIARRLVELLSGTITVGSGDEGGARFTVRLPCTLMTPAPGTSSRSTEARAAAPQPRAVQEEAPGPLKILLAEDNRINNLFIRTTLEDAGHQVVGVTNGTEALQALSDEGPFHVVLMDVQMPELDGVEATRRIRARPDATADVPIIALTAFAMNDDRTRFLEAGMDGYVTKPLDFDALYSEIRRVLRKVSA